MLRLWKTFAWLVVTTGCSFQIYTITSMFLEHETVNRIVISRSLALRPPKIVICLSNYTYFFVNQSVAPHFPPHKNSGGVSPSLILSHTFPTNESLLILGYIKNSGVFEYASPELVNVEVFLKDETDICYTFRLPTNFTVAKAMRSSRRHYLNEIVSFHLREPFLSSGMHEIESW